MFKLLILANFFLLLALPFVGSATHIGGVPHVTPPANVNLVKIVNDVIDWAFVLLLFLATLFIVFAAYNYLTAGADPGKAQTATRFITYAVVAIIVAFVARGLVAIVRALLGVPFF